MALSANDRVALLRVKTDRAKQHILDLHRVIETFLDSHAYGVGINENFNTGDLEWNLVWAKDIPAAVSAIAGDAIQNIRTALDHMVWQLVLANGGTPKRITGFPIVESAQEYASPEIRRKIEGMRPEAIAAIDALTPYKGGNETLWHLHCLNNRDKHRLLLSAAAAVDHHDLLPSQREQITKIYFGSHPDAATAPNLKGVSIKPTTARFPLEVGKVFFSIPKTEMENNFRFTLGVTFNEPGVVEGEPLLETVKGFSDLVENIISAFAPLLL